MNEPAAFEGVVGYWDDADAYHDAVGRAQAARLPYSMYLPFADRATVPHQGSPVRWVSLAGGLIGIATAVFITVWMSQNYPLVVGGKSIVSWPPFLVVCFELMVLFGAIFSVLGFLWFAYLPNYRPSNAYRPELAVDRFALYFPCGPDSPERARADQLLRETGARDVHDVRHHDYGKLAQVSET